MSEIVTKETTVSEVLRKKPESAHLLMSYGICNCCGGHLTLEESAKSKGIDIIRLLERVNKK
jgi:iron-sulfur cluster repair protein YtfE (RIC family)